MPKKIEAGYNEFITLPDDINEQLRQMFDEYTDGEGFELDDEMRGRIKWLVECYENKLKELANDIKNKGENNV